MIIEITVQSFVPTIDYSRLEVLHRQQNRTCNRNSQAVQPVATSKRPKTVPNNAQTICTFCNVNSFVTSFFFLFFLLFLSPSTARSIYVEPNPCANQVGLVRPDMIILQSSNRPQLDCNKCIPQRPPKTHLHLRRFPSTKQQSTFNHNAVSVELCPPILKYSNRRSTSTYDT